MMMHNALDDVIKVVAGVAKLGGGNVGSEAINAETSLLGADAAIDSLAVVEVLMGLELLAEERGRKFIWSDDAATFSPGGPVSTVGRLAAYFEKETQPG